MAIHFVFIFYPYKSQKWMSIVYTKPLQKTLQTADSHLTEKKGVTRVLKIKRGDKIYLEFLTQLPDNSFLHINSVQLNGEREAYYDYWGEITSLQILDEDGDGKLDIIAPTFDEFLQPKVNLVFYNEKKRKFELKPSQTRPQVIPPYSRSYQ